jgi:O-antigen ligase
MMRPTRAWGAERNAHAASGVRASTVSKGMQPSFHRRVERPILLALLAGSSFSTFAFFLSLLTNLPDESRNAVVGGAFVGPVVVVLVLWNWALGAYLFAAALAFQDMLVFGPLASATKVAALLTFSSLALALLRDRKLFARLMYMLQQPLLVSVFALALWFLTSILWADNQPAAIIRASTFVGLSGMTLTIALLRKSQITTLWAVLATSTFLSVVVGYLFHPASDELNAAPGLNRFTAGGMNPDDYSGFLAVVFFVTFYGLPERFRTARYVLAAVILFGLLAAQSRAGVVALIMTPSLALFIPALRVRYARRTVLALGLAVLTFVGVVYVAPAMGEVLSERYATLTQLQSEDTWTGRWDIWRGAFQIISDYPFLGIGAGNFPYESPAYSGQAASLAANGRGAAAHNMFLSVWSELGPVGLASFVGVLVLAFTRALVLVRHNSVLGAGLSFGLVVYTIMGLTLTWEQQELAYLIYGSILSLGFQEASQSGAQTMRASVPR